MTTTEAKWTERIQAWRASGESAEVFAAGKGFEGSTMRFWASKLRSGKSQSRRKVAMVQLVRSPDRREAEDSLIVEVAQARVVVKRGFDPSLLRAVVAALREPG